MFGLKLQDVELSVLERYVYLTVMMTRSKLIVAQLYNVCILS